MNKTVYNKLKKQSGGNKPRNWLRGAIRAVVHAATKGKQTENLLMAIEELDKIKNELNQFLERRNADSRNN